VTENPEKPLAVTFVAMNPLERRASASLSAILALRMLGLFLVLPVFALEARQYPGGDDPALLGLALGIYGLTQAFLLLPFGMASDHFGRKRVIVLGLFIFALGSFWAAAAEDLTDLLVGRSLQGAGAVSAAVTAWLADLTRDAVRTKAMAWVGASIGLMFAFSWVVSPVWVGAIGLSGLFGLTGVLALLSVLVVWGTPPAPRQTKTLTRAGLKAVLSHAGVMRLSLGVFVLHGVQLAMWLAVPAILVQAGLAQSAHWQVYLAAALGSLVLLGGVLALERRGHLKKTFLGAIVLIAGVQIGLLLQSSGTHNLAVLAVLLFLFFCGFNALVAMQTGLASRLAPTDECGTAWGVYCIFQSLGLFVGGWGGGWLVKNGGSPALFACCAVAMLVWWLVALPMQPQGRAAPVLDAA
jgi:hypothetical protein